MSTAILVSWFILRLTKICFNSLNAAFAIPVLTLMSLSYLASLSTRPDVGKPNQDKNKKQ